MPVEPLAGNPAERRVERFRSYGIEIELTAGDPMRMLLDRVNQGAADSPLAELRRHIKRRATT